MRRSSRAWRRGDPGWMMRSGTNTACWPGRVALAGPGNQYRGSSPDCSICLPRPIPRLLGALEFDGSRVKFHPDVGQSVEINGFATQSPADLQYEDETGASTVRHGDVAFSLTRHAGALGCACGMPVERGSFRLGVGTIQIRTSGPGSYTGYPPRSRSKSPIHWGDRRRVLARLCFFQALWQVPQACCRRDRRRKAIPSLQGSHERQNNVFRGPLSPDERVSEDGVVELDFNRAHNPPSAFTELPPVHWPQAQRPQLRRRGRRTLYSASLGIHLVPGAHSRPR